jgi:putative aldouronate transport system substrate-binding protein
MEDEMKSSKKKAVLFMVLSLAVSMAIFGAGKQEAPVPAAGGPPAYLNTGNTFPVVKEGENITLSAATVYNPALGGRTEDLWFWKFAKKKMNINFQVEQIMQSAAQERKNLMFASGDLKDLIFNIGLTTTDLVTYGQMEHLLYDLNKVLTPGYAPNLLELTQKYPSMKASMSCPDGGMYTFPKINLINDPNGVKRLFINTEWLKKVGMKPPETLDDFYAVLKAFKEKDPSGTGKIVPLAGNNKDSNPGVFVLSALGFITANTPSEPALRNGKIEIPCGSPLYRDYLTFMNKLYKEGLIDENFFTMDRTQLNAQIAEKRGGIICTDSVYIYLPEKTDFQKYEALSPVTSSQNSRKLWAAPNSFIIGTAVMSAKAKYPEVAMRFMDYIYSIEGTVYSWNGASAAREEETLGIYKGWTVDDNNTEIYPDVVAEKFDSAITLIWKLITPFSTTMGDRSDAYNKRRIIAGFEPEKETKFNLEYGDHFYRNSIINNIMPYVQEPYPNNIYFTAEENIRLSDLSTIITDYVEKETAKFITGANSLSNIDKYYSDLNALGFKEYQGLYAKAYAAYQANLKR